MFLNALAGLAEFFDALLLQAAIELLVKLSQRLPEGAIERLDDNQPLVALEVELLDRLAERLAETDRVKWILAIGQPGNAECRREPLRQRPEMLVGCIADARANLSSSMFSSIWS